MRKNTIVQLLFSLLLFLIFVMGSFFLIVYGGNIYQHVLDSDEKRENIEIPFAYLTNKLHQAKNSNAVTIEILEDTDVLVIENESYYTCIYVYEGNLKELSINDLNNFHISSGTSIYTVEELKMTKEGKLYSFVITNDGEEESLVLGLR